MTSRAGLGVLKRIAQRQEKPEKSPSETAVFVGVADSMATFSTSTGATIKLPIKNIITNQAWTGTFSVVRPKYGYPSVFKEV